MVTGLVTANGNTAGLPTAEHQEKTRLDPTPMARAQHNREKQEPGRWVIERGGLPICGSVEGE